MIKHNFTLPITTHCYGYSGSLELLKFLRSNLNLIMMDKIKGAVNIIVFFLLATFIGFEAIALISYLLKTYT